MDKNIKYTVLLKNQISEQKKENHFLEFKSNYQEAEKLGRYISALSNGACLDNEDKGYLYFGVQDETLEIKGTTFDIARVKAKGHQDLEMYLRQMTFPKIDFKIEEFYDDEGHRIVVFIIPAAKEEPTTFCNTPYVRVGSNVTDLRKYPDWMRAIYNARKDWSEEIVSDATIHDLDEKAIEIAKTGYLQRYPDMAEELTKWNLETFLDKAKLTINGKITRTALLLVGKEESAHFLNGMFQLVWRLRTDEETAGEIFGLPFIISTTKLDEKIRNYRIKIYPDNSLIPAEVWRYSNKTILEALHNCIAHQDYNLGERIIVTEEKDQLIFENGGSFYQGTVEDYIEGKKTPEKYRNKFLVRAMVNLKMIDTQGYGIHGMFLRQKESYLPMPDYNKSTTNKVILTLPGRVINRNYSLMLMNKTDMDLTTAYLLDKVQKGEYISDEAAYTLRRQKLIEGRKPKYIVGQVVAQITHKEAEYTNLKGFDEQYYLDLITHALEQHGSLKRADFNKLLIKKLPEVLSEPQKIKKVSNLLSKLKRDAKIDVGKDKVWHLVSKQG